MTPQEVLVYVADNGGGTFFVDGDKVDALDITYGYAVGMVTGDGATLPDSCGARELFASILRMAEEWMTRHVGVWVNGGQVILDPVVVYKHQTQAIGAAERYRQRAIYDFANRVAIEVM